MLDSPLWARGALCASLILALGCDPDPAAPNGPDPDPDPEPPALILERAPGDAGNDQEALRGTQLGQPLRVRVTRDGVPVSGVPVAWAPYLDTASGVVTGQGVTDEDGIATGTWTLGVVGANQVAAELETGARVLFQAKALPASLEILDGDNQQGVVGGVLANPVRLRATFGGIPLGGETIVVIGPGAAKVSGPTDASGEASVQVTMRTAAGTQLYYFRTEADGPQAPLRLVRADAMPDAPARVSWVGLYGGVVDRSKGRAQVHVQDQWGNLVPRAEVHWRIIEGTGELEEATTASGAEGYAAVDFSMATSATARLGATVGSMPESVSTGFYAWDLSYTCPWGCNFAPAEITRPAGYAIRFQNGESCRFETAVPGITVGIPSEFTIGTPGTYEFRCPDAYYSNQVGRIIVTP